MIAHRNVVFALACLVACHAAPPTKLATPRLDGGSDGSARESDGDASTVWKVIAIGAPEPFVEVATHANELILDDLATLPKDRPAAFAISGCGATAKRAVYCWRFRRSEVMSVRAPQVPATQLRLPGSVESLSLKDRLARFPGRECSWSEDESMPAAAHTLQCEPIESSRPVNVRPPRCRVAAGKLLCDGLQEEERPSAKMLEQIGAVRSTHDVDLGACALSTAGQLYCAGMGSTIQWAPGPPQPSMDLLRMRPIPDISDVSSVFADSYPLCITRASGALHCWPENEQGRHFVLPPGPQADVSRVQGVDNVVQIGNGAVLRRDGAVFALRRAEGSPHLQDLRNQAEIYALQAVPIEGASRDFVSVDSFCGLHRDGSARCWVQRNVR